MKQIVLFLGICVLYSQPAFYGRELLGRVTNTSVTVNVAPVNALDFYFEYGTTPGTYTGKTAAVSTPAATPMHVLIDKLQPDTRYYYRLRYRDAGTATFLEGEERSFRTQRPRGSTFSFAMQFDPHMDENSDGEVYKLTLRNQLAGNNDFLIDLGDTFMSDKLQPITEPAIHDRVKLMRTYYDIVGHSQPMFLSLGNHEGEWGRNLNGTANNVAVWDTLLRKKYIPNPVPGDFFSGDSKAEPLVGVREAYYSFEWGDALFVILDPYWNRPVAPEAAGDWSLTLGRTQYDWLKSTLENSKATYKFVFAHNLIGGRDLQGPMRGGIETAKYLEWGGVNMDDSWGFEKARPGWPMPIHQLLVANNVTAFFHGHDHLYAKQELDGVVYQEGPQPSARNFNLGTRGIDYSYTNGTVLGGTGYIRVTVSPTEIKSEYIQTWLPAQETAARKNGMVGDTWTVKARTTNVRAISAASYTGGTVAPESIVAVYGTGLGNTVMVKDSAGVERKAEVLAAAETQVNFVIPAGTKPGRAQLTIGSSVGDVLVDGVAPGLFSASADGKGTAAAVVLRVKSDGSQSTQLATSVIDLGPATDELYLSLYGTGLRLRPSLEAVSATIGGQRADVLYAGPQPAFAGLDQVNLRIPRTLAGRGEVPVVLSVDGHIANTVTVNIR